MDGSGAIVERWEVPRDLVLSIAAGSGKMWATVTSENYQERRAKQFDPETESAPIVDRLLDLLPGGKVEPRGKVEVGAEIVSFSGGKTGRARVDCFAADQTKQDYHYPYCTAIEPGGWRKVGLRDGPPLACGDYLVEILDLLAESDLPHRNKKPQIAIRRLDTGEVVRTKPFRRGQAVACGASGELLVGSTDVQALSLPDLKPVWRMVSPRGRVVALASAHDRVWVATSSGRVASLDRTAPRGHRGSI
jgi:hypothetical protein